MKERKSNSGGRTKLPFAEMMFAFREPE